MVYYVIFIHYYHLKYLKICIINLYNRYLTTFGQDHSSTKGYNKYIKYYYLNESNISTY